MTNEFEMRPIYEVLLRGHEFTPYGLYHLHLATAEQLCRLHYSRGSIKAIKARLKALVDADYLQADTIPTKQFRAPYYYTLGAKGVKYLAQQGYDTGESWRASKEVDKHSMFVDHTLELNDVLIAAMLTRRTNPKFYLAGLIHERDLKRNPYKATWRAGLSIQSCTLIPDAFLDLRCHIGNMRDRRLPVVLEHDRGTEGQKFFRKRIRAYIQFLKSGAFKERFRSQTLTVAFTTFVGEHRRDQMRRWASEELLGEPDGLARAFLFTTLGRPIYPKELWWGTVWLPPHESERAGAMLADVAS